MPKDLKSNYLSQTQIPNQCLALNIEMQNIKIKSLKIFEALEEI